MAMLYSKPGMRFALDLKGGGYVEVMLSNICHYHHRIACCVDQSKTLWLVGETGIASSL